jgi:hypothetical protein
MQSLIRWRGIWLLEERNEKHPLLLCNYILEQLPFGYFHTDMIYMQWRIQRHQQSTRSLPRYMQFTFPPPLTSPSGIWLPTIYQSSLDIHPLPSHFHSDSSRDILTTHWSEASTTLWLPTTKTFFFDACRIFAGSSKMNQQICCKFEFCMCARYLLVRRKWTSKYVVSSNFACVQDICWFVKNEPANML